VARGRGGVFSGRQFERLGPRGQARYERELEVIRDARTDLEEGRRASIRQSFRDVFDRYPSGRDYRSLRADVGSALRVERGRLTVTGNDRLYRGEYMPMPTSDGVYDAMPGSWRQRSIIGDYWSLISRARGMTDEELAAELARFRGVEMRVYDPELGRVVRKGFIIRVDEFRAFATSPEARQERVVSPGLEIEPRGQL